MDKNKPIKTIPPPRKNLINYLPPFLQEILEMRYILDREQDQLNDLDTLICDLLHDQFIEIATETGIARWEKILEGILPYDAILEQMLRAFPPADPEKVLEYRRKRIQEKIAERLPYTRRTLCDRLNLVVGKDNYEFSVKGYNARASVYFEKGLNDDTLVQFALMQKTLYRFLPANLTIFSSAEFELPKVAVNIILPNVATYRKVIITNDLFFRSAIGINTAAISGISTYKRVTVKSQG